MRLKRIKNKVFFLCEMPNNKHYLKSITIKDGIG